MWGLEESGQGQACMVFGVATPHTLTHPSQSPNPSGDKTLEGERFSVYGQEGLKSSGDLLLGATARSCRKTAHGLSDEAERSFRGGVHSETNANIHMV